MMIMLLAMCHKLREITLVRPGRKEGSCSKYDTGSTTLFNSGSADIGN
jgi:hypothetical protein